MQRKQKSLARDTPTIGTSAMSPPSPAAKLGTYPTGSSQYGSLLTEKPRAAAQSSIAGASIDMERDGKGSSSSSDEGYQSGLEPSILPLLLRKKLEGRKRNNVKPSIPKNIGLLEDSTEPRSIVKPVPQLMEVASRKRREGITKVRSPGSYFPAAESLKVIPRNQEDMSRVLPVPVRRPAVYTPLMASPLRASTSSPASPIKVRSPTTSSKKRRLSMTSPTGLVFSDPFPQTSSKLAVQTVQPEAEQYYTSRTSPRYEVPALTPAIEAILEEPRVPKFSPSVNEDVESMEKSNFFSAAQGPALEHDDEDLARAVDIDDAEDSNSDTESIRSTEVFTANDIRNGLLPDLRSEELLDCDQEALTEAEKDLTAREPEILIPGPRRVIGSEDIRDRDISFGAFPTTYSGTVPRIEVSPGAIQNTQGEVIPIGDEDIHLAAGETLIDGTGRVWNAKGMIEPGRNDQGEAILYEVDIAQIRRANNGELPAMMPWDDAQLFQDGWRAEGTRTPSYNPSDGTTSEFAYSDMSFGSPPGSPYGMDRRISDTDYLDSINEQLDALGPGDGALDDIEMAEVAEEQEAAEEAENLRARRKKEDGKGM